jgi:hypothetical protein
MHNFAQGRLRLSFNDMYMGNQQKKKPSAGLLEQSMGLGTE